MTLHDVLMGVTWGCTIAVLVINYRTRKIQRAQRRTIDELSALLERR